MYIKIKSENPNLSYVLNKNPNSGMTIRSYRKGHLFGWYNDGYNIYFKDGDDEVSAGTDVEFEYNDNSRYNSPILLNGAIDRLLPQLLKSNSENDVNGEYETNIVINNLYVYDEKYFNILERHFKDITFTLSKVSPNIYNIDIKSSRSIGDITKILYTISLLYRKSLDIFLTDADIEKYIHILNEIDAPYFVKYIFKINYITNSRLLKRFKKLLEQNNNGDDITFIKGNTHSQRADFIIDNITGVNNILDLGCSDLFSYGIQLIKKMDGDNSYYAIDIDEDELEKAKKKVMFKVKSRMDDVFYFNHFNNFLEVYDKSDKVDVVMSEIFEHIKLKESSKYLKQIFTNLNWRRIIITTPNKDFNQFYEMSSDLRLEDHIFEMSKEEFENHFNELLKDSPVEYRFINIGDSINGITPTQAIIIENRK